MVYVNEQDVKQAADELDSHVVEIIKWHFSQKRMLSWTGAGAKLESN